MASSSDSSEPAYRWHEDPIRRVFEEAPELGSSPSAAINAMRGGSVRGTGRGLTRADRIAQDAMTRGHLLRAIGCDDWMVLAAALTPADAREKVTLCASVAQSIRGDESLVSVPVEGLLWAVAHWAGIPLGIGPAEIAARHDRSKRTAYYWRERVRMILDRRYALAATRARAVLRDDGLWEAAP